MLFFTQKTMEANQPANLLAPYHRKCGPGLIRFISLLKQSGGLLRMPYSEHLNDGIFQIRAQQEGNISRVLYFFTDGQKIILTNGFTKKTPKTPPAEIERAKRYRADYQRKEAHAK